MSRADLVRLAGIIIPGFGALLILFWTGSFFWFAVALIVALLIGIPVEMLYRRLATPDEIRRDLRYRVDNPP